MTLLWIALSIATLAIGLLMLVLLNIPQHSTLVRPFTQQLIRMLLILEVNVLNWRINVWGGIVILHASIVVNQLQGVWTGNQDYDHCTCLLSGWIVTTYVSVFLFYRNRIRYEQVKNERRIVQERFDTPCATSDETQEEHKE